MPLSPPVDITQRLLDRLPEQFKGKPRIAALATSYGNELQAFADAQWTLYSMRLLQNGPAYVIGRAHFFNTTTSTLTWSFPFKNTNYLFLAGKPVVLDGLGGTSINVDNTTKTKTGITVLAGAPFTGYVDVLAWNIGEDPTNRGAGGDLLDKLGKIVGQPRNGMDDPTYFIFITAKIRSNKSDGKRETLIALTKLLVPGASIYVKDFPPCSVYIAPQAPVFVDPYAAAAFLIAAKAAGVNVVFAWSAVPIADTVIAGSIYAAGFAAGPPATNTGVSSSQSPGSVYASGFAADPVVTGDGGGVLCGVIQSQGEE